MGVKLKNNAATTIASSITSIETSITVASGTGDIFPSLGASDYFYATLATTSGVTEVVKVTARTGDALSIVRAQEGTVALSFPAGSKFELRITAQSVIDVATEIATLKSYTVATLPTGSVGMMAFASDGRKSGEGAGLGTGVAVYYDGAAWRTFDSSTTVAA